jgi:5'-deoxynucleotidase YfbR-like HD superfamily hydrolase
MAFKFLKCTIHESHPDFAEMILELWKEYEEGISEVARLVQQIGKLECMLQAVSYEEQTGKDMSEFMKLGESVTLPQLQPLLEECLTDYQKVQLRKRNEIVVIFVSSMLSLSQL